MMALANLADSLQGLPAVLALYLLARALCRCLCLRHPFGHLGFDCVEIEARASLHRRILKECLELLTDYLLDEYEAPELVFEPVKVLLRAFFCAVRRPARALERIKPQVSDVGHVWVCLF